MLILLVALVGSSSSAYGAIPADGSGLGISDAEPIPSQALDSSFARLQPRWFRFIMPWDGINDPGIRAQAQDRIIRAGNAGVQDIAVTFGVPAQLQTHDQWLARVAEFITFAKQFAPNVQWWWSPANEPNHTSAPAWIRTTPHSGGNGPYGTDVLAHYSWDLAWHLAAFHPNDKLLSPDFHDGYQAYPSNSLLTSHDGRSTVAHYIDHFLNGQPARGQLGSAVAWHPYGGVRRSNLASTIDLAGAVPGRDIFVTEVGSRIDLLGDNEVMQNAQVQWMANRQSGLASHAAVKRIAYYQMRDSGQVWDSALRRRDGTNRPAWETWCAALHGGNPLHPMCGDRPFVRPSTGSAFAPEADWAGYQYFGNRGTFFADVTGDGKADAIAVNDHLGVVVRRSTGGSFAPNEDWSGNPFWGNRGTFFADVTGDGKADAIAVNETLGVTVRRSTGGSFALNEDWTVFAFVGNGGKTFFADATGDGRADAIAVK